MFDRRIRLFLLTFLFLLVGVIGTRFLWLLLFFHPPIATDFFKMLILGFARDLYVCVLPTVLLYVLVLLTYTKYLKKLIRSVCIAAVYGVVAIVVGLHVIDIAYYFWSSTRLDAVFMHNLGWHSLKAIVETALVVVAPAGVALASAVVLAYGLIGYGVIRKLWSSDPWKSDKGVLTLGAQIVIVSLLLVVSGYLQEPLERHITIKSPFWRVAAQNPVIELFRDMTRRRKVRGAILATSQAKNHIATLKKALQGRHHFDFDPTLNKAGYALARAHTAPCFKAGNQCPQLFQKKQPNIIVIIVESLAAAAVSHLGTIATHSTPHLDTMAANGISFTNFFANSFQTSSGLVATLCSAYPNYGERFARTGLGKPLLCMSDAFHRHGYETAFFTGSSTQYDRMNNFINAHQFDRIFSWENDRNHNLSGPWGIHDGVMARKIADYLRHRKSEKPVFLTWLTISTHPPFVLPNRVVKPFKKTVGKHADYLNSVHYLDAAIGSLKQQLEESGLMANTLIVVTADHSLDFKNNGFDLFHARVRRDTVWIPLIMYGPQVLRNVEFDRNAVGSQVDIAPTLLAAAGIDVRNAFMGRHLFTFKSSPYAVFFNPYKSNLVTLIEQDLIYKFSIPSLKQIEYLDTSTKVTPEHMATLPIQSNLKFINALFYGYNYLLYHQKLWNHFEINDK